jgi:hypothetical protein
VFAVENLNCATAYNRTGGRVVTDGALLAQLDMPSPSIPRACTPYSPTCPKAQLLLLVVMCMSTCYLKV